MNIAEMKQISTKRHMLESWSEASIMLPSPPTLTHWGTSAATGPASSCQSPDICEKENKNKTKI